MTMSTTSTIALVTCDVNSRINFAHVVGELRRFLDGSLNSHYTLIWNHDDIAAFDFESARMVLSIESQSNQINDSVENRLFISVGPPFAGLPQRDPEIAYEKLCSMIVERVCANYETKSVYWQQTEECITSETVDRMFDQMAMAQSANTAQLTALPDRAPCSCPKADTRQQPARANQLSQPAFHATSTEAANDVSTGDRHDRDRLRAIRTALYEVEDAPDSAGTDRALPISRLAATVLDVTLVVVCLPVGAAMLTYHIFRGGELRHTAHVMTLTGLFLASSKMLSSMPLNALFS